MGLRLTIRRSAWKQRLQDVAADFPGLIPVVKGNGYGFGRRPLMPLAATLSDTIAVGTVFEADDVPADRAATVLTPHLGLLPAAITSTTMLTVGSVAHVEALHGQGWTGTVAIKLQSTMHRHGVATDELAALTDAISATRLVPATYLIHLPLAGTPHDHAVEVESWLPRLDASLPVSVSHLDDAAYAALRLAHPDREFTIRLGTQLWHGDKSFLHLSADVLDVHPVRAGTRVGYQATRVDGDGHVVLVAAGSAHGVQPLDDGRSPFHFARGRLALLEAPHMHTSMLFVAAGDPCPRVGDRVDVQRPLTMTTVDELDWVDD
jgi:alanine racemase